MILLRPTKSLTLHIQQSMRSMRYKADKSAIIIDHVGNVFQHGLPDDDREWTLEAKKKKKRAAGDVLVKECPKCFAIVKPAVAVCPVCGQAFEINSREIQKRAAELAEITRERLAKRPYNDYKTIKTFEELQEFQRAKKYKFGWTLFKAQELNLPIPQKYRYMMGKYYGRA